MNYEPNTKDWKVGDYVIHDADRKETRMLMCVVRRRQDGLVVTRYVDPWMGKRRMGGDYINEARVLHDPARFDIPLPLRADDSRIAEWNAWAGAGR